MSAAAPRAAALRVRDKISELARAGAELQHYCEQLRKSPHRRSRMLHWLPRSRAHVETVAAETLELLAEPSLWRPEGRALIDEAKVGNATRADARGVSRAPRRSQSARFAPAQAVLSSVSQSCADAIELEQRLGAGESAERLSLSGSFVSAGGASTRRGRTNLSKSASGAAAASSSAPPSSNEPSSEDEEHPQLRFAPLSEAQGLEAQGRQLRLLQARVSELSEMFADLQQLVERDGEGLAVAEKATRGASEHTAAATRELAKASRWRVAGWTLFGAAAVGGAAGVGAAALTAASAKVVIVAGVSAASVAGLAFNAVAARVAARNATVAAEAASRQGQGK